MDPPVSKSETKDGGTVLDTIPGSVQLSLSDNKHIPPPQHVQATLAACLRSARAAHAALLSALPTPLSQPDSDALLHCIRRLVGLLARIELIADCLGSAYAKTTCEPVQTPRPFLVRILDLCSVTACRVALDGLYRLSVSSTPPGLWPLDIAQTWDHQALFKQCAATFNFALKASSYSSLLHSLSEPPTPNPRLLRIYNNMQGKYPVHIALLPSRLNILHQTAPQEYYARCQLPDQDVFLVDCLLRQHEGTNTWITTMPAFKDFRNGDTNLWVVGGKGTGKTSLAATIIEEVIVSMSSPDTMVCFYFCDFRNPMTFTARVFIRVILLQLAKQDGRIWQLLTTTPWEQGLAFDQDLVARVMLYVKRLVLIIDGIDDSLVPTASSRLLGTIENLYQHRRQGFSFNMAILTQPAMDIDVLECMRLNKSRVDIMGCRADVDALFEGEVRLSQLRKHCSPTIQTSMVSALKTLFDGNLLLFRLQLRYICQRSSSLEQMGTIIQSLPKTTGQAYTALLENTMNLLAASGHLRTDIFMVLIWISALKKPLSAGVGTWSGILPRLYRPSPRVGNGNNKPMTHAAFMELLSPFAGEDMSGFLTLNHSSVSAWLLQFSAQGHNHIAEYMAQFVAYCISPLVQNPFDEFNPQVHGERRWLSQLTAHHRFYLYAAAELPTLLEAMGDPTPLSPSILKLFGKGRQAFLLNWVLTYIQQRLSSPPYPQPWQYNVDFLIENTLNCKISPLHIAACLGLEAVCNILLREPGMSINQGGPSGSPLYCAITGIPAITGGILRKSSLVSKLRGESGRTIKLLMDRGAVVKAAEWPAPQTTLTSQLLWGCINLEDAALFDRLCRCEGTRLVLDDTMCTSVRNYARVGGVSADGGPSDKDFIDRLYSTLIDISMRRLHEAGEYSVSSAEFNLLCSSFETARNNTLRCALVETKRPLDFIHSIEDLEDLVDNVFENHAAFVRCLQDERLDCDHVPTQFGDGSSLLHRAVELNLVPQVVDLLRAGANIDILDTDGRTPLHLAESVSMMETLLAANASPDIIDADGRTLLHIAAANNDVETLKFLASQGLIGDEAMELQTKKGYTPMTEALRSVSETTLPGSPPAPTAAIFLSTYCQVGGQKLRPADETLHYVAEWGSTRLFDLLNIPGRPISASTTPHQRTPLHQLNFGAELSLVRKLKEKLKLFELQDDSGRTPAETILLNYALEDRSGGSPALPRNHPSTTKALHADVYAEIVTEETIKSVDKARSPFWARICDCFASHFSRCNPQYGHHIWASLATAMQVLIAQGTVAYFEQTTFSSALSCGLLDNIPSQLPAIQVGGMLQIIGLVVGASRISDGHARSRLTELLPKVLETGDCNLVRVFISGGAEIYNKFSMKESALVFACSAKASVSIDVFKTLLETSDKQRLNGIGYDLVRALLDSRVLARTAKLEALLQKGLDPNGDDFPGSGQSPVMAFLLEHQFDCVPVLLSSGADPEAKHTSDVNVATRAASLGQLPILERIVALFPNYDWAAARTTIAYRQTLFTDLNALHLASLHGHPHVLEYLSSKNLLPDLEMATEKDGMTPLHFAVLLGSNALASLRYLLDGKNVSIDPKTAAGLTPLALCYVMGSNANVSDFLIRRRADLNITDKQGNSPWTRLIEQRARQHGLGPSGAAFLNTEFVKNKSKRKVTTPYWHKALEDGLYNAIRDGNFVVFDHIINRGAELLGREDIVSTPMPGCKQCTPIMMCVRIGVGRFEMMVRLVENMAQVTGQCDVHFPEGFNLVDVLFGPTLWTEELWGFCRAFGIGGGTGTELEKPEVFRSWVRNAGGEEPEIVRQVFRTMRRLSDGAIGEEFEKMQRAQKIKGAEDQLQEIKGWWTGEFKGKGKRGLEEWEEPYGKPPECTLEARREIAGKPDTPSLQLMMLVRYWGREPVKGEERGRRRKGGKCEGKKGWATNEWRDNFQRVFRDFSRDLLSGTDKEKARRALDMLTVGLQTGVNFQGLRDADGNSVVHLAVRASHWPGGYVFLERLVSEFGPTLVTQVGFNFNLRDFKGRTALMVALELGLLAPAALLMKANPQVVRILKNFDGMGPLNIVASSPSLETTVRTTLWKMLMQLGCQPLPPNERYTPVHEVLVKNFQGQLPLGYVLSQGWGKFWERADCVPKLFTRVIQEGGGDDEATARRLRFLCRAIPKAKRHIFLELEGAWKMQGKEGVSPLSEAVMRGMVSTAGVLFEFGAKIETEGEFRSLLEPACLVGDVEMVKLLVLKGGATPRATLAVRSLRTALGVATQSRLSQSVHWILVGRGREKGSRMLCYGPGDGGGETNQPVSHWSGILRRAVLMSGFDGQLGPREQEGRMDYLKRISPVLRGLGGKTGVGIEAE